MNPIRILAPSVIAFACVSCFSPKADQYDTSSPYGPADSDQVSAPATDAVNPVYDTPAAYEDSASSPSPVNPPSTVTSPNLPAPVTKPSSNGAAIIHTVVAGDTLSGISAKYKVPSAAIKQANNMTKDTVVLGKKMVIPPNP
jgi:LysM repeat protein